MWTTGGAGPCLVAFEGLAKTRALIWAEFLACEPRAVKWPCHAPNLVDIIHAQAFLIGILMQISSILDYIDNGHMALPEFQRGYVWGREQVQGLFQSLDRGHPVGRLLVWATDASTATHRGDAEVLLVGREVAASSG